MAKHGVLKRALKRLPFLERSAEEEFGENIFRTANIP